MPEVTARPLPLLQQHWTTTSDGSTARLEVEGEAAGSAVCALVADSSVQVAIIISDADVGINALYVRAITSASLEPLPSLDVSTPSFTANVSFSQIMEVEGATSYLYAYVETDDGQLVPVPHAEVRAPLACLHGPSACAPCFAWRT